MLGLAGWPLEIVALLLAPLTVVQPCLASGLVVLLWLGVTRSWGRGRGGASSRRWRRSSPASPASPGRRPSAPPSTPAPGRSRWRWAWSRSRSSLPYLLRGRASPAGTLAVVSAGFGYAWTAIASKLLTDELAAGALLIAVAWLATAAASEGLALLSEMSALQRRPATQVAPVMFAVQVLVPVILAPLIFEEKWSTTPLDGVALVVFMLVALAGVVLLAGSKAVGAVLDSRRIPSD